MSTATPSDDRYPTAPEPSGPVRRGHVGSIVAASMFGGFTALFPSVSRLGVGRLAYPSAASGLPPDVWAEARALLSTPGHNRGYRDDAIGLEAALTQAQALTSLDDKPLIVVTAVEDAHAGWLPLQEEMVGLSTNSVQRVIQDASHASLIEDEGDSANAIDAILDVVAAVRAGGSL